MERITTGYGDADDIDGVWINHCRDRIAWFSNRVVPIPETDLPYHQEHTGVQATDQDHERALAQQQQQDVAAMSQASDQAHQMGMVQVQQPQVGQ